MELTIAVCTYKRFDELRVCLENIQRQTLDRSRFRVLIVDNSLQTEESEAFRDSLKLDYEFEYLITPKNGIAYARNQAIAHCRTPYLGYVDDDVIIEPDWAEVLLDTFERYQGRAGCVSGKIIGRYETSLPGWLKDELLWPLAVLDWGDQEKLLPNNEWFVTASIGFDIRALRISGGFSEDLGRKGRILLAHEDLQIVTNLRRMGYGLVYNPAFRAEHCIPSSRLTQEWYCKDAFWQTVSRMVYASGEAFDLNGPLVSKLTKTADREVSKWHEQPDKESVQAKLAEVSQRAIGLMKRFGYDPDRFFPDPEYRTFYIVTPSYNAAETIEETLKSIFSQSGNHFIRYHVQDGGSTDGTLELLQKWEKMLHNNELPFPVNCRGIHMTWSSSPDDGMYDAIRKAFADYAMQKDDVMTWLNADDLLADGALSTMDKVFADSSTYWAFGTTATIEGDAKNVSTSSFAYPTTLIRAGLCDGFFWKHIQQEGSFWRSELWDKVGGLSSKFKHAGDWDLWRRFAQWANPVHVDIATAYFRIRSGQLSEDQSAYMSEINATVSEAERVEAAESMASTARQILYEHFDLQAGKKAADPLMANHLPRQVYENYKEFALPYFDNAEELIEAGIIAPVDPEAQLEVEPQPIQSIVSHQPSEAPPPIPKSLLRRILINRVTRTAFASLPVAIRAPFQSFSQASLRPLLKKLRQRREYASIQKSNLFFRQYYLDTYPDIAETGVDPLQHFIEFGSKEGRSPNPLFCEVFYKTTYRDVAESGGCGLLHYISSGWKERRDPHPDFSTSFYLTSNPDVAEAGVNPLSHYFRHGMVEGREASWTDPFQLDESLLTVSSSFAPLDTTASRTHITHEKTTSDARQWMMDKAYSKNEHWPEFDATAMSLMGHIPNPEEVDLKIYQDLFTARFIELFVPKGSRILEIGGGDSRILRHFSNDYECWNLDKLEGHGNGPTSISDMDVKLVRDYIGEFNDELPEDYFDFIFSLSVFEHIKDVPEQFYQDILDDIVRVSRDGCQNLHTIDIVHKKMQENLWACPLVHNWMPKVAGREWSGLKHEIMQDENRFEMSRARYERSWQFTTGKSYDQFGAPISLNLYWDTKIT